MPKYQCDNVGTLGLRAHFEWNTIAQREIIYCTQTRRKQTLRSVILCFKCCMIVSCCYWRLIVVFPDRSGAESGAWEPEHCRSQSAKWWGSDNQWRFDSGNAGMYLRRHSRLIPRYRTRHGAGSRKVVLGIYDFVTPRVATYCGRRNYEYGV
jgi:hypothetical protein